MQSSEKLPLLGRRRRSVGGNCTLVIHGGAGILDKQKITPELQLLYKSALVEALQAGYSVLKDGGEAMDAVTAAVVVLEDCPLFNSGKGAVFNRNGVNELEASIMLSKPPRVDKDIPSSRRGISATLLTKVRNPSRLVRALYLAPELVPHTFLSGKEVEKIGEENLGQILVDESYFWTEKRWREHRRGLGLPEEPLPYSNAAANNALPSHDDFDVLPQGTVGAVALDSNGCIASLTSTGGLTNKIPGRIGDTPLMGAGFWAEEWRVDGKLRRLWRAFSGRTSKRAVGISGTRDGDFFIRSALATTIASRMRIGGTSLRKATKSAIAELTALGGSGGLIAVDEHGNVALSMNSSGMFRGAVSKDGIFRTAIFDDEPLSTLLFTRDHSGHSSAS